jgi:DNA-binding GntR family transcriptional regulator
VAEPGGFEPVNFESTASIIARELRSAIMHGSLPPGRQLNEADLAGRFQVSRGPIREAMQRLVQEGLLRSERNRGVFVITLEPDDVRDIYFARAAIERAAVSLILHNDPKQVATRLESVYRVMEAATRRSDSTALCDADLRFHELLVAQSGSRRLSRMYATLLVESRMCLTAMQDTYQFPDETVREHGALVAALRAGDQARVSRLIDTHTEDALRRLAPKPSDADDRSEPTRRTRSRGAR